MPKKKATPPPIVRPYQLRLLTRLLRGVVAELAHLEHPAACELAALLVDRIRSRFKLGG